MAIDFTNPAWTEVDPGDDITVAASRVTITAARSRQDTFYVYRDMGVDYFDGDFTHRFEIEFSSVGAFQGNCFWALANIVTDRKGLLVANADALYFHMYENGGVVLRLTVLKNGTPSDATWTSPAPGTTYYITINRDDDGGVNNTGRITAYIRTGSHSGALQDTLIADCGLGEQNDYRYIYAAMGVNDGYNTAVISGFTQSLDLAPPIEASITAGVGLGAEAGTPKPESVTWNPFDKHAEIVLSLGDLRASSADDNGSGYFPVRATAGKSTGKWYFEVAFVLPWDFVRIGVANLAQSMATGQFPGVSTNSWGYAAGTGKKYYNNSGTTYGDDWTDGDVIGIAVDMDTGKIWFSKNGVWQASGDPSAGTNQAYSGLSGTLYPMAGPYGSFGDSIHCDAKFIESDFSYSMPSGFEPWDDFDKAVEAGAGLGATVEADTLSDTIEPGVGVQAQVEAETTYNKEVSAGAGVSAQATASGIYGKEVEAGVGIQAESTVFNWAEWLAIYGNQYTARYYLTLTGAPDDLADVVIPISSFQYRLRDNTPSYLQVVIPGIDYATDIANRANGELIVEMAYLVAGVEQHREQLARVDLEDVQIHEGPRNKSIILVGHRTETWGAQIVTLRGITYQSDKNGLIRIRCAEPDLFLRPGNTVKAGDETFTAGQVMTAVAKHTQWMEVVEAA